MKRLMLAALVGMAVFSLGTSVLGEGVPWKNAADGPKEENKANEGSVTAGPADLKSELPPAQYDRIIKPIETKVADAEKVMDLYRKEMEKPEEKRNAANLVAFRQRAWQFYLAAAQSAKQAIGLLKNDAQKTAVTEQYEKPNKQKAVDILLELASEAETKKDLRMAVALYQQVLKIDPENATAKEALERLKKAVAEAARTTKTSGSRGGDDEDKQPIDPSRRDFSREGRNQTDYGRTGRNY